MRPLAIAVVAFFSSLWTAARAPAGEGFDVVSAGQAAPVVLARDAPWAVTHAADQWQHYIGQVTGCQAPRLLDAWDRRPAVWIGVLQSEAWRAVLRAAGLPASPAEILVAAWAPPSSPP